MARLSTSLHPKLTDSKITILNIKKIKTVFDFVAEDSEKLMRYSGLTYQEILDLKQNITKLYIGGVEKGNQLLKDYCNNVIQTGISSLDNLMHGGLSGGQIYEICGLSSSGKSQLCHTIAINIVHNAMQQDGIVHYIDTKGDFSGQRTLTILKSKKLNEEEQGTILDNIMVTRMGTIEELMNFLHSLVRDKDKSETEQIKTESKLKQIIKLIIIDSVPALFFNFHTETSWMEINAALNRLANILRCLSNIFNIPLITINLITQWRENNGFQRTTAKHITVSKAALGKYWASVPGTRLYIETLESENRKITVWKSCCSPTGSSCNVNISNSGVS